MEILLTEEKNRHTLLPIRFPAIWEAYKNQEASFWLTHEVSLSEDLKDWNKLSDNERHFLKMILAFFASSDLIVNENLEENFTKEVKVLEAKICYDFQKVMENIHSLMYSLLIDTYITDLKEKDKIFNAVETIPIIKKMADWTRAWIKEDVPFSTRVVVFACVEGILFSGPFASIFWLKERGLLPGLCKSNDFISRDEASHVNFGILLHSQLKQKCPEEIFYKIIKEATALEIEFITEALPCSLLGMNSEQMKMYIKYVANRLVLQFGYKEIYPDSICPFPFMDRIALKSKSNFFEKRPTEYSKKSTVELEDEDPYKNC